MTLRYGTGNHSMKLNSYGYWQSTLNKCDGIDNGPRDGLDSEWDAGTQTLETLTWLPNVSKNLFVPGCAYVDSTHWDGSMTAAMSHVQTGEARQSPSHLSKYNDIYAWVRPKSSANYGNTVNWFRNYTHAWNNVNGDTSIRFCIQVSVLNVCSAGTFTGNWNKNGWGRVVIW